MADEQDQNNWQNNKEINPAENSSVTAGGEDTENNEGSWRATDESTGASGEAQKPFGEGQDPADGQGEPGDPGSSETPSDQPWSPGQADEPPTINRDATDRESDDDDGRNPVKIS